jgi:metal-responsive CopG/Arc/MetJ family transcriptional regulator
MAAVKTAITLDRRLLERIDEVARELELPRSRVIARAAEEYLRRHDSARMLAELDAAYAGGPTAEERRLAGARRQAHRRVLARR